MTVFCERPEVARVLGHGETKSSVLTRSGVQVDLRVVPIDRFGAAILYFTGSKEHNIRLRERAIAQGMRLNEYGLFKEDAKGEVPEGAAPVAAATEEEVYAALGLEWIPPTMREDRGECDAFAKGVDRPAPIVLTDIKAELHSHTTASDGSMTIDQLVDRALVERVDRRIVDDDEGDVTDIGSHDLEANGFGEGSHGASQSLDPVWFRFRPIRSAWRLTRNAPLSRSGSDGIAR